MGSVLIIGGGVAGLGSALTLAAQGHDVTVVERDEVTLPATPDEAFVGWPRRGAPQVRHSHAFLARLRNLLRDRQPHLLADLLAAGATELRFTERLPETMTDTSPMEGDEDLVALACRRTTFEWVLRKDALEARDVRLVQGAVSSLLATTVDGRPHVTGVVLDEGTELTADWVIDASGRRSPLPAWFAALGIELEEREEDTGIVYSSRFYKLVAGAAMPPMVGMTAGDLGFLKFAVFIGDNDTYSITFGVPTEDADLRRLLREPGFTDAARVIPALAPWVDESIAEPLTGVEVMARLLNRSRRFLSGEGEAPLVTGLLAVGDAHTCTNPLYGRGCSLGFVSAHLLAEALGDHGDDPVAAALAYEASMRREVHPWYRSAVAQDRQDRSARGLDVPDDAEGDIAGGAMGGGLDPDNVRSLLRDGLMPAVATDPVVFRAFLRMFNLLDPPDRLLRDPDLLTRVLTVWQDRENRPAPEPFGPDREGLLAAL
ncbi:MAG TPA: tryptophan 7-halogenase [Acidimicrobiales bacterium]|nr:tryptophan 7-halogenase [Acidimicrobiales bacterium]